MSKVTMNKTLGGKDRLEVKEAEEFELAVRLSCSQPESL